MLEPPVHLLMEAQHGLIARRQALALGLSPDRVRGMTERGLWTIDQRGVYGSAGAPRTPERAILAAVLAAGPDAMASHRSAAYLWDLIDAEAFAEITVPRRAGPSPRRTVVHRIADVDDAVRSVRRGVPVTNPLRTLVDLGSVLAMSDLRSAVHAAVARHLVTYSALEAELDRLGKPGRHGVGPLRRVVTERFDRRRAPSVLEARTDRVIAMANIPAPEVERIAGPDGEYRTDYRWRDVLLILEVKGFAAHGSPEASAADIERELAIAEADGYQIISADWALVTRRPRRLARQLETIYWRRRRLLLGA